MACYVRRRSSVVREVGRKSLAMIGSAVLHAAPVVWGMLSMAPHIEVDLELEFTEVELIDPDTIQGAMPEAPKQAPVVAPPPPEVKPPAPATEPTPEPPKPEPPKPEPPKEPERDLGGQKHSKVDELGPTNSTYFVMLVPKKIRKLSFAEQALDVMAPLPDFEYLITAGGFDALRDFDHIVIASPDLRDWRQTFLAVDYRMSRDEVQRGIERAAAANDESIEWIEENGIIRGNPKPLDGSPDVDNRWFVLLEDHIAVYVRDEFLRHIIAPEPGDEKTAGNFVANLVKLRSFAARQPTAGLQVVMKDLRASLKRAKLPFTVPDGIELSAEATEDPELLVRVEFSEIVDAKAFEKFWREDVGKLFDSRIELKLVKGIIYDPVELARKNTDVQMWSRFDAKQAKMILGIIADNNAKYLRKTPEQLAELRRQRQENWLKRNKGKLPPSALGGGDDEPKPEPPAPAPAPAPAP